MSSEVEGQLLVATHSSDILRGFLEGTQGNIRILRIHRDGDTNKIFEAHPEAIKKLWEKPVLRYSNALEGIFHEQTIICEDHSDCRLFNAVSDYMAEKSQEMWKDTAYVPAGGKDQIAKVADVLRQIGVPTKAIFDIDFLSDRHKVEEAVEAFGGKWKEVKPFWMRVNNAVKDGVTEKTAQDIKNNILSILNQDFGDNLPKREIIQAMKEGNSWNMVKKFGVSVIPNGQPTQQYNILKMKLQEIGIFLVDVGEIENFYPEAGSHGPKHVTKLLSDVSLDDPDLRLLREFVEIVHKGPHAALPNTPYPTNGDNSLSRESASSICPEKSSD